MIFLGDDWSSDHHDVEIQDGRAIGLPRGVCPKGCAALRSSTPWSPPIADDPAEVAVGIKTDRGLWVGALVAAGYQVYAVNPKAVARYRERHELVGRQVRRR